MNLSYPVSRNLLRRFVRIVSSQARHTRPCKRVRAFEIATSVDASWSDLDYGRWQGRSIREIHDEDAAGLGAWLSEPGSVAHGGESLEALQRRVRSALESNREAGVTLVVTHAIVVKTVLATVLDAPLTAIYCMDLEPLSASHTDPLRRRMASSMQIFRMKKPASFLLEAGKNEVVLQARKRRRQALAPRAIR